MTDYSFDYLETIVGISFPSKGGYILVRLTATANAPGTTPPPPPAVAFTFPVGGTAALVDKSESTKTKVTPTKTGSNTFFFVFNDVAGTVTAANYNNIVANNVFPPVTFATQFARSVGSPSGFKDPEGFGVEPVPEGGSGLFSTAAIAAGYAFSWNGHIHGAPAGAGAAVYLSDGSTMDANPAPVSVHSLTVPVVTPATSATTLTGAYLIKVPLGATSIQMTVTTPQGNSTIDVFGFHGPAPKKVAQANPLNSDSGSGGSFAGTKGVYTIVSTVVPTGQAKQGPLENTVTVTVNSGGGG